MQGRLSAKPPALLQSFPYANWEDEFSRARRLGFSSIEWLYDKHFDEDNPLMSLAGREKIKRLMAANSISVDSICAHAFIDGSLGQFGEHALTSFGKLIETCAEMRIRRVVLPLIEGSSMRHLEDWKRFIARLRPQIEYLQENGLELLLESDWPQAKLVSMLSEAQFPAISLCYDVGNRVADGFDPCQEFTEIAGLVGEVHIKDRSIGGASAPLGQGDVDFDKFLSLIDLHKHPLVLETPVGEDWEASANANLVFVQERVGRNLAT